MQYRGREVTYLLDLYLGSVRFRSKGASTVRARVMGAGDRLVAVRESRGRGVKESEAQGELLNNSSCRNLGSLAKNLQSRLINNVTPQPGYSALRRLIAVLLPNQSRGRSRFRPESVSSMAGKRLHGPCATSEIFDMDMTAVMEVDVGVHL
jgi:hypothetical protein